MGGEKEVNISGTSKEKRDPDESGQLDCNKHMEFESIGAQIFTEGFVSLSIYLRTCILLEYPISQ